MADDGAGGAREPTTAADPSAIAGGGTAPDTQSARRTRLGSESSRLLEAIDRIHDLETEKRTKDISTPAFHRLADEILDTSRSVFRMASTEEHLGGEIETGDISIDDVARPHREA